MLTQTFRCFFSFSSIDNKPSDEEQIFGFSVLFSVNHGIDVLRSEKTAIHSQLSMYFVYISELKQTNHPWIGEVRRQIMENKPKDKQR